MTFFLEIYLPASNNAAFQTSCHQNRDQSRLKAEESRDVNLLDAQRIRSMALLYLRILTYLTASMYSVASTYVLCGLDVLGNLGIPSSLVSRYSSQNARLEMYDRLLPNELADY